MNEQMSNVRREMETGDEEQIGTVKMKYFLSDIKYLKWVCLI